MREIDPFSQCGPAHFGRGPSGLKQEGPRPERVGMTPGVTAWVTPSGGPLLFGDDVTKPLSVQASDTAKAAGDGQGNPFAIGVVAELAAEGGHPPPWKGLCAQPLAALRPAASSAR